MSEIFLTSLHCSSMEGSPPPHSPPHHPIQNRKCSHLRPSHNKVEEKSTCLKGLCHWTLYLSIVCLFVCPPNMHLAQQIKHNHIVLANMLKLTKTQFCSLNQFGRPMFVPLVIFYSHFCSINQIWARVPKQILANKFLNFFKQWVKKYLLWCECKLSNSV